MARLRTGRCLDRGRADEPPLLAGLHDGSRCHPNRADNGELQEAANDRIEIEKRPARQACHRIREDRMQRKRRKRVLTQGEQQPTQQPVKWLPAHGYQFKHAAKHPQRNDEARRAEQRPVKRGAV